MNPQADEKAADALNRVFWDDDDLPRLPGLVVHEEPARLRRAVDVDRNHLSRMPCGDQHLRDMKLDDGIPARRFGRHDEKLSQGTARPASRALGERPPAKRDVCE